MLKKNNTVSNALCSSCEKIACCCSSCGQKNSQFE